MNKPRQKNLIVKVLMVGALIAVLGYLFHPDIGQFSLTVNGRPVPEPFARLAAIPTFLALKGVAVALSILLFFGIGLFMFLGAIIVAFAICLILAPYFWPVLAIMLLVALLLSYDHGPKSG